MREWLENTLAKHTGQDVEKIRKDIEVDTFLTAQEAKGLRHRGRSARTPFVRFMNLHKWIPPSPSGRGVSS